MKKPKKPKKIYRYSTSSRNYDDPAYKIWRKAVYSRDKRRCRWPACKSRKRLNAHHIRTWAEYPRLRYEEGNGITLCGEHHEKVTGVEHCYVKMFLTILSKL